MAGMVEKQRQPKTVSEVLRAAVQTGRKSGYQLAKETGLDTALVSRFKHGRSGLSMESIDKLAEALSLELVAKRRPAKRKSR